MALGEFGSTLNDELNRLANGGTYRDKVDMVDEALAAKQWANRENIIPYSTDTVGILNEIAGLGLDKKNWLDFNGVCNYIAGTTGLPAAAALRQVYPTTDLLTSQASYYVDATAPRYNYPGFIYLPGIAGQYLSTPDSAALDITGDIDIRAYMASDAWTGRAANGTVLAKFTTGGNQRSYILTLMFDGTLRLIWTTDGINNIIKSSTAAVGFANGSAGWIRATLDVNNGASGNDVRFFTSTNGTTWTQLGTTVTTAGVTSIYSGTSQVEIGSYDFGTGDISLPGKLYQVQVFASLDGTDKRLDVDLTTNVTSATYNQFTATTGQLVTINGQDVLTNLGAAGSLLPTTVGSSTAADSNDPKFLDHTGTNYVYLPGVASNYLSVPDSANLRITGDLDLRAYVALDSWTPSSTVFISKRNSAYNYQFYTTTTGRLLLEWFDTGTSAVRTVTSTVSPTVSAGQPLWVRVTLDADNGASGNDVIFYTSTNGTTWTQLGTTVTTATVAALQTGTDAVEIGSRNVGAGSPLAGKVFRAQIFNGIDGTKVLDVDTSVITTGAATSFTAVTGQTVTINRSTSGRKSVAVTQPTWLFGTDDYMEVNNRYMSSGTYLYLPGVTSNMATSPDSAALSITGDLDLRVKVALDDWTPAANTIVISKAQTLSTLSYSLAVQTDGKLNFLASTNGSTWGTNAVSSVATGVADGATKWIRATFDVDNGAGGRDVQFFTSDDGTNWTQLGTTITTAGTFSIIDNSSQLEIGSAVAGSNSLSRGKFFRAQVRNGINGTVAFDANFESSITSLNQASFTESSANAATVTINRSGSAYRSAGITTAGYLYPGATNTFAASAIDYLNFGASQDFTIITVNRLWNTPASSGTLLGKRTVDANWGYVIRTNTTAVNPQSYVVSNGTLVSNTVATTVTAGTLQEIGMIVNRSTNTISTIQNGTTATGTSISTVGSTSNVATFQIGALNLGANAPQDFEFIGAAVFRSVLTATQIRQITNYFANREVYL
jgi:hypothetical protein